MEVSPCTYCGKIGKDDWASGMVDWSDGCDGDKMGGGVTARGRGQEVLSHSACTVPKCNSIPARWRTASTACRGGIGIAIRKAACTVSGAYGGVLASLETEVVGKGLPLRPALLSGAEGVEISPDALCVCKSERLLRKKDDLSKRLIRVFVEDDAFGADVKTSGCSNEETMSLDK